MSDTPDVRPPKFATAKEAIAFALFCMTDGALAGDYDRLAQGVLDDLAFNGNVVVKADGLQHGDELVRLGTTWSSLTGDPPPPPTYVLRRPVPENGERPHTHTRGIDRGDCPECDAEYGDTNG